MNDTPAMDLSWEGQRRYCERLGILDPAADIDAWYRDPVARQVAGLLGAMETHRRKMTSAASWITDALAGVERKFQGAGIHTTGMHSGGEVARYALDYDAAVAAYCALEDRLRDLVNDIRRRQGYEPHAFARLEDHPELSPQDDQAVRDLDKMEQHLRDFRTSRPAAQRRILRDEHDTRPGREAADLATVHDQAHAGELAALKATVAAIRDAQEGGQLR